MPWDAEYLGIFCCQARRRFFRLGLGQSTQWIHTCRNKINKTSKIIQSTAVRSWTCIPLVSSTTSTVSFSEPECVSQQWCTKFVPHNNGLINHIYMYITDVLIFALLNPPEFNARDRGLPVLSHIWIRYFLFYRVAQSHSRTVATENLPHESKQYT